MDRAVHRKVRQIGPWPPRISLRIPQRMGHALFRHVENMTKVAILPEPSEQGELVYRAIAGGRQSLAKTAGAALDALTAQLPAEESGTLVIVQSHQPDEFFTAQQQARLQQLMERWRAARETGAELVPSERAELHALVEAEVQAAGKRAAALRAALGQ